jgi:hypothetical protein
MRGEPDAGEQRDGIVAYRGERCVLALCGKPCQHGHADEHAVCGDGDRERKAESDE